MPGMLLCGVQTCEARVSACFLHQVCGEDTTAKGETLSALPSRGGHECICRCDILTFFGNLALLTTIDNLDRELEKYLKKYFPQEVKEKQRANEIERGIEDYGPGYKHSECAIM